MSSEKLVLFCFLSFAGILTVSRIQICDSVLSNQDYFEKRSWIIKKEDQLCVGGNIKLTQEEISANKIILQNKLSELEAGYTNITNFYPATHFFRAKDFIKESQVFSMMRRIPKGASLHTHMLAAVEVEFIMDNISYSDNLYGCFINDVFKLRFMDSPNNDPEHDWKSLTSYRAENPNFDFWLRQQLSLEVEDPESTYPTPARIWQRFKKIFTTEYDMLCYRPVFQDYIHRILLELLLDNVFYTELRGTFMPLYELNGSIYDSKDFFKIFIKTVEDFKTQYPDFQGVRYIHSIYRGVTPEVLKAGLKELIGMKELFPDFIAGFDFVGYEEEGHQLVDYSDILLEASKHLKFFFHAGETNWYGHTDENIVDAILLNTSRIGHGFALEKHPILVEMARKQNIAIELCPISNQVLMLNNDHRNHPVVPLLATDFPVVICNDDPSVWGATGLSYDWYMVFMAMTPQNAGIEALKQFAINSIKYSAMEEHEKKTAMEKWQYQWERFLELVNK